MNYGYQNELDFVYLFNNKYFMDLDENSQYFLGELFEGNIKGNPFVRCWKNHAVQKADIFIRIDNYVKGISLKCGNSNSMHHEQIQEFERYLGNVGIPYKVIDYYLKYHYGYGRKDNGDTDYSIKYSAEEYKRLFQSELDIFNNYINKTRIIIDMIDRFIVRGRNSDYDIDALICGTVEDYIWILKHDLYDLVLSKRCIDFTSPHIACMTLGPKKRDLDGSSKNRMDRYLLCVRWNFIREDIINFRNDSSSLPPSWNK
jgi:hypothetical protein